jgi:hypothetical protein
VIDSDRNRPSEAPISNCKLSKKLAYKSAGIGNVFNPEVKRLVKFSVESVSEKSALFIKNVSRI